MHNIPKGKIGESLAIARFLEKSFEVFSSVADIDYTDIIVAPPKKPNNLVPIKLLRIQIKSITSTKGAFRIKKDLKTIPDYYFLINTEDSSKFWIVPSKVVSKTILKQKQSDQIKDALLRIPGKEWEKYEGFSELIRKFRYEQRPKFRSEHQGKVGEKLAVSYFLRKGDQVYDSIADYSGVDLVVKRGSKYLDVQVKYATKSYSYRNISKTERSNYYYLFINGYPKEEYFFIPSRQAKNLSKSGGLYLTKELRKRYGQKNDLH